MKDTRRPLFLLTLAAVVIALVPTGRVVANEYSLYGDAGLGLFIVPDPAGAFALGAYTDFRFDHRLSFDWGELTVRHKTILDGHGGVGGFGQPIRHVVNQAALSIWPVDAVTFQLGRFSIPWGVGYVFHPGDALHPVRSPDGETPGFDGVAVTWTPSTDVSGTVALRFDTAYGPEWHRRVRSAVHGSAYVLGVDVKLGVVFQEKTVFRPSVGLAVPAGPVVFHAEAAVELAGESAADLIGGDTDGVTDDPAQLVSAALGLPDLLAGRRTWASSAGANYSRFFGSHTITVLGECLFIAEPPAGLGRHFVYPSVSWDWDARFQVEQAAFLDVDGRRAVLATTGTIAPFTALEFTLGLYSTAGLPGGDGGAALSFEAVRAEARLFF